MALSDHVQAGRIDGGIVGVLSNIPGAPGLAEAGRRGYVTETIPSSGKKRHEFDREVVQWLHDRQAEIVCLAGFMRLLSPLFIEAFPNRILNIHPSLLPAFPGLHAQRQALEWGARITGCTVHFVDEKLDHGPSFFSKVCRFLTMTPRRASAIESSNKSTGPIRRLWPSSVPIAFASRTGAVSGCNRGPWGRAAQIPRGSDQHVARVIRKFNHSRAFVHNSSHLADFGLP